MPAVQRRVDVCHADMVAWPLCRRYYICDNKLNSLGWTEKVGWKEGLQRTIDWYLQHGFKEFWDNGDVEAALQPHPVMHPQQMLSGSAVTTV